MGIVDTQPDGPLYVVGDRVYFSPSLDRMPHGTAIRAGMAVVVEIVDHGTVEPGRDRWTYVVQELYGMGKQGTAEKELHLWDL